MRWILSAVRTYVSVSIGWKEVRAYAMFRQLGELGLVLQTTGRVQVIKVNSFGQNCDTGQNEVNEEGDELEEEPWQRKG